MTKFLPHARNRTTTRFVRVEILSHFCPRCDKFCHNSLIHQSKCHISYRNSIFVMTKVVPSLSHLICVLTNVVQFLSPVCHIFWIFIHFLCIKCIFWYFVPFLSHFLSHGTNFVTFLTPQKPSNTKGFHVWSKICHIFQDFVPSLSRVCHVHKPRGYAVYT